MEGGREGGRERKQAAPHRALHWHALVEHAVAVIERLLLQRIIIRHLGVGVGVRVVIRGGIRRAKGGRIIVGIRVKCGGGRGGRGTAAVAVVAAVAVIITICGSVDFEIVFVGIVVDCSSS